MQEKTESTEVKNAEITEQWDLVVTGKIDYTIKFNYETGKYQVSIDKVVESESDLIGSTIALGIIENIMTNNERNKKIVSLKSIKSETKVLAKSMIASKETEKRLHGVIYELKNLRSFLAGKIRKEKLQADEAVSKDNS